MSDPQTSLILSATLVVAMAFMIGFVHYQPVGDPADHCLDQSVEGANITQSFVFLRPLVWPGLGIEEYRYAAIAENGSVWIETEDGGLDHFPFQQELNVTQNGTAYIGETDLNGTKVRLMFDFKNDRIETNVGWLSEGTAIVEYCQSGGIA